MCNTTEEQKIAIQTLQREMGEVRHTLYGNDRPGHIERLASLERAQVTQTWLLRLIVGGVLSNTIALAFLILRRGV